MEEIIISIIYQVIGSLIEQGITYIIRQATDELGNWVTQIVVPQDRDGDGVNDYEDIIYSFDTLIPDTSNGFCLCNRDDEVGIGLPMFDLIDSKEFTQRIEYRGDGTLTGNDHGYILGRDVYCPLPVDFDGDGQLDWGKVIDDDDNGIPDASPEAPFYPVGSDGFRTYIENSHSSEKEKSFIIVSAEGTVSVYDPNGDLTEEDYDKAYTLWLKDNAALDKPFKNYSVTEALLLIVAIFAGVSLIGKLFKRRAY